jgi:hypothetical protein
MPASALSTGACSEPAEIATWPTSPLAFVCSLRQLMIRLLCSGGSAHPKIAEAEGAQRLLLEGVQFAEIGVTPKLRQRPLRRDR